MTTIAQHARNDIAQGFREINTALFLAWDDIRERYVRTFLGPMWIVLSTGIWFGVMGFVMGNVFNQKIDDYLPYLVCGLVGWLLISNSISEGSQVLISAKRIITSFHLPIFLHFLRFMLRNFIIFLHNAVILVIVLILFPPTLTTSAWLALLGLILNLIILTSLSVLLSLANIRYRDTHLVISNALQVLPYVTPIFWQRDMLQSHRWVADLNPIYHMIEVVRAPMLGGAPAMLSWVVTATSAVVLPLLAYLLFLRYRHRIIFWL